MAGAALATPIANVGKYCDKYRLYCSIMSCGTCVFQAILGEITTLLETDFRYIADMAVEYIMVERKKAVSPAFSRV